MSPNIVNQSDCLHSLRSLREENSKCDAVFSMMTDYFIKLSRLESQSADVTIKDVVQSDNKEIIHLLEAFIKLGKSAEEDLHQIQKYKENREIYDSPVDEEIYYGVTGVNLKAQQETTRQYVPEDLFGYNKESLPQDQSAFKVNALLTECERLLVKLTGGPNQCGKDAETLHHLVIKEKSLMIELRRVLALTYCGFHAPLNDKKHLHSRVNSLFKSTYGWLLGSTDDVGHELNQIIQCAWVWESGPPLCLLAGSILEKMNVRIYGLPSVDLDKAKMFITSDGEFKQQDVDQKEIWLSKTEDPNDGIVLHTPKISLKNLKGDRKRGSDPKLYRVALSLNVPLQTSTVPVECTSLPFAVRTGSPQLWPYIAHIVWYLWTQQDVRSPDKTCPREVPLSSIASLIQARISGSGLQPLDTREEPMEQGNSGICVQDRMLRRLTDGERDGWEEVLKQRCGPRTREKGIVSRENFTKTSKQIEAKEIGPWALICGAVNTALRLQKFGIDKYFYIGLSNDQCKSLTQVNDGEFIFRSSLNKLNCSTSKEPLTSVVFEVCSGRKMRPMVELVDHLESYSLKDVVSKISLNQRGNTHVHWILPSKQHVFSIVEKERPEGFKGLEYTNIKQKQFAPETVLRYTETPPARSSERKSIFTKHQDPIIECLNHIKGKQKAMCKGNNYQAKVDNNDEPIYQSVAVHQSSMLPVIAPKSLNAMKVQQQDKGDDSQAKVDNEQENDDTSKHHAKTISQSTLLPTVSPRNASTMQPTTRNLSTACVTFPVYRNLPPSQNNNFNVGHCSGLHSIGGFGISSLRQDTSPFKTYSEALACGLTFGSDNCKQQGLHACEAENGDEPIIKKCAISKHGGFEGTSVDELHGDPDNIAKCYNNHDLTDPQINQNVIEPHDNHDLLEPHNEMTEVMTNVFLDGSDTTQSSEISKENGSDICYHGSVKDNALVSSCPSDSPRENLRTSVDSLEFDDVTKVSIDSPTESVFLDDFMAGTEWNSVVS